MSMQEVGFNEMSGGIPPILPKVENK
jgi:hypothetical protein